MPLLQGEVPLLTLYADCHYYFSPPNSQPQHHRFDKRSYVYLYHDALNRRGRLEVANHAGTPNQDAFNGYLDSADIEYSYKHPTLFTITVHGRILSNAVLPSAQQDVSQWHLPAADVQNNGKYMFRLHTIDLYMWTADDAGLFLDSLRRVTAPGQVRVLDANLQHPEHRDSMSPVVQQLEKVAITNPGQPPQNLAQRTNSVSTTHTTNSAAQPVRHAATPVSPPAATPVLPLAAPQQVAVHPPPPPQQQASNAPAAYNPAAPAAPEPIAHREKTPPPEGAENGTGLMAAATNEHGHQGHPHQQQHLQQQPQHQPQQYSNPLQQQFSPQPAGSPYTPGYGNMPPPSQQQTQHGMQRTNTLGHASSYSGTPGIPGSSSQSPFNPSFGGPPQDPNAHLYGQQQTPSLGLHRQNTLPPTFGPGAPSHQFNNYNPNSNASPAPSAGSPGFPTGRPGSQQQQQQHSYTSSPVHQQQPQQQQQGQPQPMYGGQQPGFGINHAMHQQVYVPEGGQPGQHHQQQHQQQQQQHPQYHPQQQQQQQQQQQHQGGSPVAGQGQPGTATNALGKLDKGISKFLKKLDKKA